MIHASDWVLNLTYELRACNSILALSKDLHWQGTLLSPFASSIVSFVT
jgi:hypothetical protein